MAYNIYTSRTAFDLDELDKVQVTESKSEASALQERETPQIQFTKDKFGQKAKKGPSKAPKRAVKKQAKKAAKTKK